MLGLNISLEDANALYEEYEEKIAVLKTAGTYNTILSFAMMFIEWVITKVFGINMKGFANVQMDQHLKYQGYLIKIGEKRRLSFGQNICPELMLLITVCIQTVIFAIVKIVHKNASEQEVQGIVKKISGVISTVGAAVNQAEQGGGAQAEGINPLQMLGSLANMFNPGRPRAAPAAEPAFAQ